MDCSILLLPPRVRRLAYSSVSDNSPHTHTRGQQPLYQALLAAHPPVGRSDSGKAGEQHGTAGKGEGRASGITHQLKLVVSVWGSGNSSTG